MPERTATIVGGGPAGLMAAEVLADAGVQVTIHEHMASAGRKFLLAGRGGLNLTHSEDLDRFLDRYGVARPNLEDAIRAFDPAALGAWCHGLGEPTFVGSSGRVFPESFRATPLLRAWLARLGDLGVELRTRHRWVGFDEGGGNRLTDADGTTTIVDSDVTLFALGGASWPRVGSTGSWREAFVDAGIEVTEFAPANCGLRVDWSAPMLDRFAGAPLKNVIVHVDGHENSTARGDVIVAASGLEGGPIYGIGSSVRAAIGDDPNSVATLRINLQPDRSSTALATHLAKRQRPKDSISTWLRRAGLSSPAIALLREATGNDVPSDPAALADLMTAVPITVTALMPLDRAISTAGGVTFDQLDHAFMLRDRPGTFVVGEMLDWEAPTGGYLLQACFSTAVAAANGAIAHLSR